MSCNRRGLCGCGRASCAVVAWWTAWLRIWRFVGHDRYVDACQRMIDDAIDFEREQEREQEH